MKHVISMLLLISFASIALAQTEKGNFLVGGTLTANRSSQSVSFTDITAASFGLSPSISYFVVDRLAAGIIANYSYSTSKSVTSGSTSNSQLLSDGFGPTVRYYFP